MNSSHSENKSIARMVIVDSGRFLFIPLLLVIFLASMRMRYNNFAPVHVTEIHKYFVDYYNVARQKCFHRLFVFSDVDRSKDIRKPMLVTWVGIPKRYSTTSSILCSLPSILTCLIVGW